MLVLTMKRIGENSEPIMLEVNGDTYHYGDTSLFEKLAPYINYKILVKYKDEPNKSYTIREIFDKNGIPAIFLD